MPGTAPHLTIQTASLYASGDASTFTGTGGPFGFSPFTSQFGGIISSAGLAGEAFNDTVYSVAAGDEVTFVIAIQNMAVGAAAYSVSLRDIMPTGFVVPTAGIGLTVADGTGTDLASSGNLFGAGLLITAPITGYDANSGLNVLLVTFSLDAGTALPGPYATLQATAQVTGYAATAGGADLSAANPASAITTVVTAAPVPLVTPETNPSAVATGQTVAFDVTLTIPTGSLQDLRITPVMTTGTTYLTLVSSSVISIGSGLQAGTPQIGADGVVAFGTLTAVAGPIGSTTIVVRILVRAAGTVSGAATLQTSISAVNSMSPGGRWVANVSSSVGVIAPPPPPVLSGLMAAQATLLAASIHPFSTLIITDSAPVQTGTLVITLQDAAVGRLSGGIGGSFNAAGSTFQVSGALSALQAAARQIVFTPTGTAAAHFTITVVDAAGGIAQDSATTVAVSQPSPDPLFDAVYYLAHNPDVAAAGVDPYQHYMTTGWKEGRNPSASFNTSYVLAQNPGLRATGANPLTQFETTGWKQGLNPSATFDTSDYLAANPDVRAAGFDPLLHYLAFGHAEGRAAFAVPAASPDPLVDAAYYYAHNPDVKAAGFDASAHYLASGWKGGRNPDAWFDSSYYLAQNPDVRAAGIDPLLHFEQFGWKEGRMPSLLFDDAKYLAQNPDVRAAGFDPLLHYLQSGQFEGRATFLTGPTANADPLVNAAYYDPQLGATLIPTGPAAAQQAAANYAATGWQRGLNPDAWFNTSYYLSHNPDVAAAHVNPLLHYETAGWKEGRNPSAAFSTNKYLAANPDVRAAGFDPLLHFVANGQAEGRLAYSV